MHDIISWFPDTRPDCSLTRRHNSGFLFSLILSRPDSGQSFSLKFSNSITFLPHHRSPFMKCDNTFAAFHNYLHNIEYQFI